jgi:hypothetical protein
LAARGARLAAAEVETIRQGRLHTIAADHDPPYSVLPHQGRRRILDWIDDRTSCIIHLVDWNGAKQEIKAQRWFLYRPNVALKEFESLRIFGSRKVGLLYLHLGARGVPSGQTPQVTASSTEPARPATDGERQEAGVRRLEDGTHVKNFFDGVEYRVDVVKKMPAPLANLAALAGVVQAGGRELALSDIDVWGGRVMELHHVPSDVTARLLVPRALAAGGRQADLRQ